MASSILVVGAGFAGACYARTLAEHGFRVRVIDQRDHIAGNAYDFTDENGVRRHRYGPHLFHTNNQPVVDWLRRFGTWIPYEHRVRAKLDDGRFVPLPINIETIRAFAATPATIATPLEARAYLASIARRVDDPGNAAAYLETRIGTEMTELFYGRYTRKMWGLGLEEMDASVVKRVSVRDDAEDRYFPDDRIQILPRDGYASVFENILDHDNIVVDLNVSFHKSMEGDHEHVFASMPIDAYFASALGDLPYRSLRFHHRTGGPRAHQSWSVTNYTDEGPRTRETAWHLLPHHRIAETGRCTYSEEEPCDYRDNAMERYYPVKTADGRYQALYRRYKALAEQQPNITFIGRCGTYQYLDMHQVICQSLKGAEAWVRGRRGAASARRAAGLSDRHAV